MTPARELGGRRFGGRQHVTGTDMDNVSMNKELISCSNEDRDTTEERWKIRNNSEFSLYELIKHDYLRENVDY